MRSRRRSESASWQGGSLTMKRRKTRTLVSTVAGYLLVVVSSWPAAAARTCTHVLGCQPCPTAAPGLMHSLPACLPACHPTHHLSLSLPTPPCLQRRMMSCPLPASSAGGCGQRHRTRWSPAASTTSVNSARCSTMPRQQSALPASSPLAAFSTSRTTSCGERRRRSARRQAEGAIDD